MAEASLQLKSSTTLQNGRVSQFYFGSTCTCGNPEWPSNATPSRQIPRMFSRSDISFNGFPSTRSKSALSPGTSLPLSVHPNRFAVKLVAPLSTSVVLSPDLVINKCISRCKWQPKTKPGAPAAVSDPLSNHLAIEQNARLKKMAYTIMSIPAAFS